MLDANLLLALHNIKGIIEDVTKQVVSNYTTPEDPVIRFLEYGLAMDTRDIKRAHWLALYYKGTPQAFSILEEFAKPVEDNNQNVLYYQQYIKFSSIEWFLDDLYISHSNTTTTTADNSVIYISQDVARYNLQLVISFATTKAPPDRFIQYLMEYAMHMILVNNISVLVDNLTLVLDAIRIIIERTYRTTLRRRYVIHRLAKQWY